MSHEQCKAITTRSGLQLKEKVESSAAKVPPKEPEKENLDAEQTDHENTAPVESSTIPEQATETVTDTVVPGIKF